MRTARKASQASADGIQPSCSSLFQPVDRRPSSDVLAGKPEDGRGSPSKGAAEHYFLVLKGNVGLIVVLTESKT